jgi:hypothetical protein
VCLCGVKSERGRQGVLDGEEKCLFVSSSGLRER